MALAATPSLASAAGSTCTYDPATKTVTLEHKSGSTPVRIVREGNSISFGDPNNGFTGLRQRQPPLTPSARPERPAPATR
jgi:predicted PhzF superfamily epimerase YddE/YHI9